MRLVIGTQSGVFVSRKPGDVAVALGLEKRSVRHLSRPNGDVLAGSEAGVFRSADGGATWKPSGVAGRFVWDLAPSPDGARALFAVTEPAAVYRSDDGGHAWSEVAGFRTAPGASDWCLPLTPPAPARARTIVLDAPHRYRVGVEVGGVLATDDGGATWTCVRPGGNPDLHVMVRDPARPNVLYASTGFGRIDQSEPFALRIAGMFRSDDFGATWRFLWKGMTPPYTRPLCIDLRPPHAITVGSSPTAFSSFRDAGGAQAMLYQSDDGGETWRSLGDADHSPSTTNFHAVTADPAEAGAVLVGTETGEVWRVTRRGEWTLLARDLPMVQALLPLD